MGGAASHTNVTEGEHERDLARTDCPSEGCSDTQSDDASQSSQGSRMSTPPMPSKTSTSSASWLHSPPCNLSRSLSSTGAVEDDDAEWQKRVAAAMRCEVTGDMPVDDMDSVPKHSVPKHWITHHPAVR